MDLRLVTAAPTPDLWAVLEAAQTRGDVPADVQAAIAGALAYRAEIVRHLETITVHLAQVDAREEACTW